MKKASIVLLVILLIFFSTVTGYLIGHQNTSKDIIISYKKDPEKSFDVPNEESKGISSDGKININTASVGQLLLLPDIGETLAKRIIDYRTQYGEFYSVEDLLLVKGIGEKKLEQLRDLITVGG